MPKRKARKSQFSVLTLRLQTNGMTGCVLRGKGWAISRTQDTEERSCVLRAKGWLFQEVSVPKNVTAYHEGKDGYFKESVYRRTQLRTTRKRMAILRSQYTEERSCVLRGKGWLFQKLSIPQNVAAYYEGKDGYLEKSVYRRTQLRTTRERMAISTTQYTEERSCVLRGVGWVFQELRIPKNVAAYYKGKDGYFKDSGYRRTQIFSHRCLGICICCLFLLRCNSVHF